MSYTISRVIRNADFEEVGKRTRGGGTSQVYPL
jgi:hypothetical protein